MNLISVEPLERIQPALVSGPDRLTMFILADARCGSDEAEDFVRRVVHAGWSGVSTVAALSRKMAMSRRTLGRACHAHGLPPTNRMLQIARLSRAVVMVREGAKLRKAASLAGYPDAFTLSNQAHRYLGVRPAGACRLPPAELDERLSRALRARPMVRRARQEVAA